MNVILQRIIRLEKYSIFFTRNFATFLLNIAKSKNICTDDLFTIILEL